MQQIGRGPVVASDALGRVVPLLERITPLAARAARLAAGLVVLSLLATLVVAVAVAGWLAPREEADWLLLALIAGAMLFPAGVLGLMWLTLRELVELPAKLLGLPGTTAQTRDRLGRVVAGLRRGRRGVRGGARSLWGLGGLLLSARDWLEIYAPIVQIVSLPFLLLVALATIAVVAEVALAVGVGVVLLVM